MTRYVLFVIDDIGLQADAQDMAQRFEDVWDITSFQGDAELITVEIVNGGLPIIYPGNFSGDQDDRHAQLKAFAEQPYVAGSSYSNRQYYGADVVVGVMYIIPNFYGWSPQEHWVKTGFFFPDDPEFVENCAQGCLDLRGADEWFLSIVEGDAGVQIAAHEIGHLLGAGHLVLDDDWLTENSHALSFSMWYSKNVTAVAEQDNNFCNSQTGQACNYMPFFSGPGNIGGGQRNNAATVNITARSVANYIVGAGPGSGGPSSPGPMCGDEFDNDNDGLVDMADPGCTSTNDDNESDEPAPPDAGEFCDPANYIPVNLTAQLIQVCLPGTSASVYRLRWDHACPQGTYQIRATQPGISPYLVGIVSTRSADVNIEGPPEVHRRAGLPDPDPLLRVVKQRLDRRSMLIEQVDRRVRT